MEVRFINNFELLNQNFERIKRMGWVEELRKGYTGSGYTFETLLGKDEDELPLPDYEWIEIKTRNFNAKTNLHLFCLTPDGDYLFSIKRVLDTIGFRKKNGDVVLYRSFNSCEDTSIIYGRKGRLNVNYDKQKVELIVVDSLDKNINIGISWSFELLKERLEMKLKYLAIVMNLSKIENGIGYYHYYRIDYYIMKDFDTFISLIDKGKIDITFKIDVYKGEYRNGKIYDHGTDFSIKYKDINLLYDKYKIKS